jgi:3-oxoacyl-[acyl-carrier-protein] synthase-3
MIESVRRLLDGLETSVDEIDLLIPHQANIRIIDHAVERLGIPPEKVFNNLERYGNTSAASIPIAMTEARDSGVLKPGDLVLMVGFGAGLSWASTLVRYEPTVGG